MKALIPFDNGDMAVNVYGKEVKIIDINYNEVVFSWVGQDSYDVLSVDEFDEQFVPMKEKPTEKPPTRRKDYK